MCYEYDTGILLRTTPYGIAFLFINLKYGVVFRSLFLFKMKERKEGISNAYNTRSFFIDG